VVRHGEDGGYGSGSDLGRKLAQPEEARFGQGNHDRMVLTLADLKKALGIHDLEQFTPKL
jgi:hypothetical protein